MNIKMRRALRATAAVAVAGSLIGVQALTSAASAGTTTMVAWTPAAGPILWSDGDCGGGTSAPSSTPTSPSTDARGLQGTQTYAVDAGPHSAGPTDTAWTYAPASGEGGPTIPIPTSTTGLAIDVSGPTSGRLLVTFTDSKGNSYVGVQSVSASGTAWQTIQSGNLTWYVWQKPFLASSPSWQPANPQLVGLQSQNVPLSLTSFFSGKTGTAQAAFELGCGGSFSLDHLQVTDASTNVTDYDLQTPTSATTISQAATKVTYGASTTIATSTTTTDNGVTTTNPTGTDTLLASVDGGASWTNAATAATGTTFTVKPTRNTKYRVQYASSTALNPQPSTSGVVSVAVAPLLKISASTTKVNVGKSVTFTARTTPVLANRTVTFQQASGTSWVALGSATTNSSGVATLTKSRSATGAWKVRSHLSSVPDYAAVTSGSVTVGVYQPVSISIYRSTSSVYVGRYFRIYGTVTPHWSGIGLQLQQYVGGRWVVVSSGHSGTRGAYSFSKLARSAGVATFRVVAPASGYRKYGRSTTVKVTIVWPPVYVPPPPPPGPGGGGSGIG